MSLVVDSSLTLAWYFQDEATPATDDLLHRVAAMGATAPVHWPIEVANAFQSAIRRRQIDRAYRDASLAELARLGVSIDAETNAHVWAATVRLADLHDLTIYVAAYLELAQRRQLPLGTLDAALLRAARASGVSVLP